MEQKQGTIKEEIQQKLQQIKNITETFLTEELPPRFSQFSKVGLLKSIEIEIFTINEKLEKLSEIDKEV